MSKRNLERKILKDPEKMRFSERERDRMRTGETLQIPAAFASWVIMSTQIGQDITTARSSPGLPTPRLTFPVNSQPSVRFFI